jgi:hypothetical protein
LGKYAHAEGYMARAIGTASHAEGGLYIYEQDGKEKKASSRAVGEYSHVEGKGSVAEGEAAHAEGIWTGAYGKASHSDGYNNSARGDYSYAGGAGCTAEGQASFVHGIGLIAHPGVNNQFIIGAYNDKTKDANAWLVIGNGGYKDENDNTVRSNLFVVNSTEVKFKGKSISGYDLENTYNQDETTKIYYYTPTTTSDSYHGHPIKKQEFSFNISKKNYSEPQILDFNGEHANILLNKKVIAITGFIYGGTSLEESDNKFYAPLPCYWYDDDEKKRWGISLKGFSKNHVFFEIFGNWESANYKNYWLNLIVDYIE